MRNWTTAMGAIATFSVVFNPALRAQLGWLAGQVLEPVFGFGGTMPELTVFMVGATTVLATTWIRHRTTDWLRVANQQRRIHAWQQQMQTARRARNEPRVEALRELQPDILALRQEIQAGQFRTMPLTMLVVVPCFAWMSSFIQAGPNHWVTAPWNPALDLTGTTVFPHWVLLYMCLSIPLGAWASKALKAWSWRDSTHDAEVNA